MEIFIDNITTPIGDMVAIVDNESLYLLEFADRVDLDSQISNLERLSSKFIMNFRNQFHDQVQSQMIEYFSSKRTIFEIKLSLVGTDFQIKVWHELLNIKYGTTRSYHEQSLFLGDEKAIRAVATANAKNKIAIIVPCHRVIGKNGDLTGYAGGIWRKDYLLKLEKQKDFELF